MKKLIATAFLATVLNCGLRTLESKVGEAPVQEAEFKFLQKAQNTIQEHEDLYTEIKTEDNWEDSFKESAQDTFWKADELPGLLKQIKIEPACKSKEGPGLNKLCNKKTIGILTTYRKGKYPKYLSEDREVCDILMKTSENKLENFTALWFTDEYCDGKVDSYIWILKGTVYSNFGNNRTNDKKFFEETVDPWWADTEKEMLKY